MDPEASQMALAGELGADRVELYTEPYARAFATAQERGCLQRYREAARAAIRAGIGINAGHDLNRANLAAFLGTVPGVLEVSIGHALIADALEFGLARTVGLYLAEIRRADASARELT
jgi:pyridoxine 5-phosphate synthase